MGSLAKFGSLKRPITGRSSSHLSPLGVLARRIQERFAHQKTSDCPDNKGVTQVFDDVKKQASSKTDDIFDETKETAQGVADRAKKVAEDAWGSTKGTAEKVGESVRDKAEQSQGALRETATRSMNTKKDPNC